MANFMPPVTVAHLGNDIFGDLHDFGQIGGLPISPKWTNLEIFKQFPAQNANWKGVYFLPKKSHRVTDRVTTFALPIWVGEIFYADDR